MRRPSLTATTDSVRFSFSDPGAGPAKRSLRLRSEIWGILEARALAADPSRTYHELLADAHRAEAGRSTYLEGLASMLAA